MSYLRDMGDAHAERLHDEPDSVVLHEEVDSQGYRTIWTEKYVYKEYEESHGMVFVICLERNPKGASK